MFLGVKGLEKLRQLSGCDSLDVGNGTLKTYDRAVAKFVTDGQTFWLRLNPVDGVTVSVESRGLRISGKGLSVKHTQVFLEPSGFVIGSEHDRLAPITGAIEGNL